VFEWGIIFEMDYSGESLKSCVCVNPFPFGMNFLFVTLALAISLLSLSALFFLAIRAVV
jgi:hypothetical protein